MFAFFCTIDTIGCWHIFQILCDDILRKGFFFIVGDALSEKTSTHMRYDDTQTKASQQNKLDIQNK